jgi:hypothetical protein
MQNWRNMNQRAIIFLKNFILQDPPKLTKIGKFGMKIPSGKPGHLYQKVYVSYVNINGHIVKWWDKLSTNWVALESNIPRWHGQVNGSKHRNWQNRSFWTNSI